MNKIFQPITIIPKIKAIFTLWVVFTIVLGLCGVLLSIVISFNKLTFITIIKSGSFYSIGIAMCASFVSIFLSEVIKNKNDITFATYKMVCAGVGVTVMIFMAGLYSSLMSGGSHSSILQLIFYMISLVLGIYAFCIENLDLCYDDYKDLDDSAVNRMKNSAQNIKKDRDGIKL